MGNIIEDIIDIGSDIIDGAVDLVEACLHGPVSQSNYITL